MVSFYQNLMHVSGKGNQIISLKQKFIFPKNKTLTDSKDKTKFQGYWKNPVKKLRQVLYFFIFS